MCLPEILQWIQYGKKTGTVVFERRGIVKKIFIDSGLIISASSNDPREYLGQVLVCFSELTEDELNKAFQLQKKTKKLLGKILTEDFKISVDTVLKSLRIKIEETIYNLFLWEDGKFVYSEGLQGMSNHDRLETAISIDQVIFEGARRVDEWREFRKTFPTDDVVFQYKGGKRPLSEFKDPIVQRIYDDIDGVKNIQRILLETHAPEYRGFEALGKLYWGEYIEAGKQVTTTKPKVEKDYQNELLKAAELYKAQKFAEAFILMEAYLADKPTDEEAQTLYTATRQAYLQALYKQCPTESIPKLNIEFSDLNEQIYSSKEGYLASRINGEWDVKSLIMISPLGELDSLRILKRLLDEGTISFVEKESRGGKHA